VAVPVLIRSKGLIMPVSWIVIALAAAAGLLAARMGWIGWRLRGRRVVTCPENQKPAGVVVDAGHAAASGLLRPPELRLTTCSRWPERRDCGQQCLSQIESSPEGCLVRNILTDWYTGKVCAGCGQSFTDIEWSRKPALLLPDKTSVEWNQVPADRLHEVLAGSAPLCFACHMASTLVREHPELVVDRSARPL
jgi:hypothetical protein